MRLAFATAGALSLGAVIAPARAGGPMRLEDGRTLHWSTPGEPFRIELVGNTLNAATVYPEELHDAVVAGLQSWEEASDGLLSFDYWQGPDLEVYPAGFEQDGVSTIFFAAAAPEVGLSRSTAAYTQVWIDADTGRITEVDIALNDHGYAFTTDPLEVDVTATPPVLLLRSVVVHELGHALGLDHSAAYDSTMFTWSWPGQDSLACDDVAALRQHLGLRGAASASGRVLDPTGAPVMAAHVLAVRDDGTVVGSALSDAEGRYAFDDLAPGRHAFIVEPFLAGPDALSPGYAQAQPTCSFGRTVVAPQGALAVAVGSATALGDTVVTCNEGLAGPFTALAEDPVDAEAIDVGAFALIEVPASEERFVRLVDVRGPLRIRTTTHGVFSPISAKLTLYDAEGTRVPVTAARPRLAATEDTVAEWDTELVLPELPRGDYLLEIGADRLIDTLYPRGDVYLDARPFALLSISTAPTGGPACLVPQPEPESYLAPDTPAPAPSEVQAAGCRVGGGATWWMLLSLAVGGLRRGSRSSPAPRLGLDGLHPKGSSSLGA